MPFTFRPLDIPDVILIEPRAFPDERGVFLESYRQSDFQGHCIGQTFLQDNVSVSRRHVLRGLHFQRPPQAQAKLVSVSHGRVWDVAVDLRCTSPTYLQWCAAELDAEAHRILYVPAGFAHGFVALEDQTVLSYKCSAEYDPGLDAGVRWDDPQISVEWPVENPVLSDKDKQLPSLADSGSPFRESL